MAITLKPLDKIYLVRVGTAPDWEVVPQCDVLDCHEPRVEDIGNAEFPINVCGPHKQPVIQAMIEHIGRKDTLRWPS